MKYRLCPYKERASHSWTEDSVRLIVTPSAFAKSALYYVQEIGHFRTFSPYFTEREQLDSYLIIYTVAGKGSLTYRKKTYTLLPNQLFFIDCKEYQHYSTDRGDVWEQLWVHLNGSSVRSYYEQYAAKGDPVLTLPAETSIPSTIRELIRIHRYKSVWSELIASQMLVELLTELLLATRGLEHYASYIPGYITEIMQHLDQNFAEKMSLDKLAKQYAVSKYHLAKEFKRYTGFSPGEYLINTRVTRGKELLKYTDLPVSEIAAEVGIPNVSHFINLFKDRTEHTPLVYRKKWQRPE